MGSVVQLKQSINNSYTELLKSVEDKLTLVDEKISSKLSIYYFSYDSSWKQWITF